MSWLIGLIIGILSYILLVALPKRWFFLQKLKQFPIAKGGVAFLGNALQLNVHRRDVLKVLKGWIDTCGRRYVMFIGLQPYVVITDAKDAEKIFSSQTEIEKSPDYRFLWPWLGLGLLTSGSTKWFHRRKQLTPAFHFKILEDFLKIFNEQCAIFRDVLGGKVNGAFDVFPLITHCALDIICESAMGRKIHAQQKSDSEYVKAIYRMSELIQYRQLKPWLHPNFIWKMTSIGQEESKCLNILHGFTDSVIKEKKKERKSLSTDTMKTEKEAENDDIYEGSRKKRLAFLDLLLEAQDTDPSLNDQNVREETDTIMFEGHDTTSAAVSWTTFLIGCNPDVQAKVHEELDSIFGNDKTREVTMDDLTKMKYLECCIKEGLRLFPSVPFIARKLQNALALEDGTTVPASATIFVFIYHLHRDPKVFPDPEKFDPTRFFPDNIQGRHPYAYAPFSAGSRNCIGQKFAMMEEKVIISTIFRNFKVNAVDKREDVNVLCEMITRPENGLHVTLEHK